MKRWIHAAVEHVLYEPGEKVEVYSSGDGWHGDYEVLKHASLEDLRRHGYNYLQDYSEDKWVLRYVHSGPLFGNICIVPESQIRRA